MQAERCPGYRLVSMQPSDCSGTTGNGPGGVEQSRKALHGFSSSIASAWNSLSQFGLTGGAVILSQVVLTVR